MLVFKRNPRLARFRKKKRISFPDWTVAGTRLTFRAELMPGRETSERTFTVARVLVSRRVELVGIGGQHTEQEFEARAVGDRDE